MTSRQHARWINSGLNWSLALPLANLRDRLRKYGYTVYDIGDNSHMDRVPPEDHTPYSETGWPGLVPYGWVTAIDIMPPRAGSGLPSLQQLGKQIYQDRLYAFDGAMWIKYMNWEPDRDNGGACYHDSWTPVHDRRTSSDRGHIHVSGRSDWVTRALPPMLQYDPIARLRGEVGASAPEGDDEVTFVAKDTRSGQYYICNGVQSNPIPPGSETDALYLARQLGWSHNPNGEREDAEWGHGGWCRLGWSELMGRVIKPATSSAGAPLEVSAEQLDAIAVKLSGQLAGGGKLTAGQYTVTIEPRAS